jgi:hypothetical protein
VAVLYALRAEYAPEPGPERPRYQPGGFHVVHDAISWDHGIEETAACLMEESAKARENGEACALLMAQNAAAADARNRQRSRA